MRLNRKHKLYYRTKSGATRRLDKSSMVLYMKVIDYFLKEGGNTKYAKKNEDVKNFTEYKPLDLILVKEDINEFERITRSSEMTVYYNGTWRPLVKFIKPKK